MGKVSPLPDVAANGDVVVVNDKKKSEEAGKEWGNPIEFLMTLLSFAVGLGNVWRFPYLCFKNGGSLSIVSLLIPTCIIIYYNILIAYSLVYAISSFFPKLPWSSCDYYWNDALCCSYDDPATVNDTIRCGVETESPARQYFYKYVLEFSDGIDDFQAVNWKLALALIICWFLIFLSLSKGVQSLGKVSYFTAIFPYVMIFVLIIRGATLPGAGLGIYHYIGSIDMSKLASLQCWCDASSQVYFILGVGQGGLYTLGKHNKFNYNHKRAAVLIAILDGFTGILAGFAIYTVLGYMSLKTGIAVPDLAVGGPGLSFIVYAEALSLMPLPQLWSLFFFLMMITIGFGSSLSLAECVLNSLAEFFSHKVNTKIKNTIFRFFICICFFVLAFPMATRSGLYIQNLIDTYLSGYPFYIFAFFEAVGLCWIYGIKRIREDVRLMLNSTPGIYWTVTFLIVPVLTFAVLIIFTVDLAQNPVVTLNDYVYPAGAQVLGWLIVAIVICPLPIFFVLHLFKKKPKFNKESWIKFFEPDPDWKPALPSGMLAESSPVTSDRQSSSDQIELNQTKTYETFTTNEAYQNNDEQDNKVEDEKKID